MEEFEVPICQGLIKPVTILGISREAMILNVTLATVFILPLKLYYTAPLFFVTHYLLFLVCKKDPDVINIFSKHYIKQKEYYFEG